MRSISFVPLAVCLAASPASATVYTYTQELTGGGGDLSLGGPDFETQLPPWDSSLGTLTAVSGSISGTFSWSEGINVNQPDPAGHVQPSIFQVYARVSLLGANGNLIGEQELDSTWTVTTSQTSFSETVPFSINFDESPTNYISDSSFGLLPDGGVEIVGCTGPCQANVQSDSTGIADGTLTLNLTDPPNPVPEPSGLVLFSLGLAGLVVLRARRSF